jgi:dihydropteroate synthase
MSCPFRLRNYGYYVFTAYRLTILIASSAIINNVTDYKPSELGSTPCGSRVFYWGKQTYVMGVINVSPDSFSGDGLADVEEAVARVRRLVSEGADIIDIGGESTRPGSTPLSPDEELRRVIPVVEKLTHKISVPLSVDTYKLEVARQALDAGANMINDIWGLQKEPGLADLAAQKGVPIVLMSNQRGSSCHDIVSAVISDLKRAIKQALDAGVSRENIIVDPGIGFGKTQAQNLEVLQRLEELKALGRPILMGSSRKSFIGWVLDLTPEQRSNEVPFLPPGDHRLEGTAATIAIGIAKGADIVRVHDVKEMARVCKMSDAIVRGV